MPKEKVVLEGMEDLGVGNEVFWLTYNAGLGWTKVFLGLLHDWVVANERFGEIVRLSLRKDPRVEEILEQWAKENDARIHRGHDPR